MILWVTLKIILLLIKFFGMFSGKCIWEKILPLNYTLKNCSNSYYYLYYLFYIYLMIENILKVFQIKKKKIQFINKKSKKMK